MVVAGATAGIRGQPGDDALGQAQLLHAETALDSVPDALGVAGRRDVAEAEATLGADGVRLQGFREMFGVGGARERLLELVKLRQLDLHQGRAQPAQAVEVLEQLDLRLPGVDVLGDGGDRLAVCGVGALIGGHVRARHWSAVSSIDARREGSCQSLAKVVVSSQDAWVLAR